MTRRARWIALSVRHSFHVVSAADGPACAGVSGPGGFAEAAEPGVEDASLGWVKAQPHRPRPLSWAQHARHDQTGTFETLREEAHLAEQRLNGGLEPVAVVGFGASHPADREGDGHEDFVARGLATGFAQQPLICAADIIKGVGRELLAEPSTMLVKTCWGGPTVTSRY